MNTIKDKLNWQPIETAPKDKPILGTSKGSVYEIQWSENINEWIDPGEYQCHPTHWMQLPEPPTYRHHCTVGDWWVNGFDGYLVMNYWDMNGRAKTKLINFCPICGEKAKK